MNHRLKLLTQKKDLNAQASNSTTTNPSSSGVVGLNKILTNIRQDSNYNEEDDDGDDDDHNDILAVVNKSMSFVVKQENSQSLPATDIISNQNKNKSSNILNAFNGNDKSNIQSNAMNQKVNTNIKMGKEEELNQEQDNYLKKKLKKPTQNINPVLMKFQNKQTTISTTMNQKMALKQQQNESDEPKIEEEDESDDDIMLSLQQNKQSNNDQSISKKSMEVEKIPQSPTSNFSLLKLMNSANKKSNQKQNTNSNNPAYANSMLFSNSDKVNVQGVGETNQYSSYQANANNSSNNSNNNRNKQSKSNNMNAEVQNNKPKYKDANTDDDEEDDSDDIEHLKQISLFSQKTSNTLLEKSQLPTNNHIQQNQSNKKPFSILPTMSNYFDESSISNPNEEINNINKQNKQTINNNNQQLINNSNKNKLDIQQEQKRNEVDLSIFDAILEINQNLGSYDGEDLMNEENDDKKSANDISMFIQINEEQEEINEEKPVNNSNKKNNNNKTGPYKQRSIQFSSVNSSINNINNINNNINNSNINNINNNVNGMSKGLQSLLKKNNEIKIQNNSKGLEINEEQNGNSNQKYQQQINKAGNNFFKNDKSQTNQNLQTNNNVINNNNSKVQTLLNQQSTKQQQKPFKEQSLLKPQDQQLNRNGQSNVGNKFAYPQIRFNDDSENSEDDNNVMKQALLKQNKQNGLKQPQNNFLSTRFQDSSSSNINTSFPNAQYNNNNTNKLNVNNSNILNTPIQNSKGNVYQTKITQYTPNSQTNTANENDYFYQNFENSYQNMMLNAGIQQRGGRTGVEESMNLSKENMNKYNQNVETAKKQYQKKQIPQLTPYKINLQLYQKKKKMKQSVDECKVWHYYLDKMYNITSLQFEQKLAQSTIPNELKDYNIKQIHRGAFNNKKIPRLTVIIIEFEILHQIVKATLLDFSGSLTGSFSKNIFMDDTGDNNMSLVVKKEECESEEDQEKDNDKSESDDEFINRNNRMSIEEKGSNLSQKKKNAQKKMDFSTVYTINHEKGTQISLKLNTLLVLKDVTVIQQNEEPPFLNISEKNVVQVVYPF